MKRLVAVVLLATITAGLGYYGIHDWDGETGGHSIGIIGITFIIPVFLTGSWILGGLIHIAICTVVVWSMSGIYHGIHSLVAKTT